MIEISKFLKKDTLVEIIYTNPLGKKITFQCSVIEFFDDKIKLSFPKDFENIDNATKLSIIIYTEEGVLSGNINLLKTELHDSIFISFPYNNQVCQRRENSRFPLHIDIGITIENNQYKFKTKNISGKGLACLSKGPLPDFENAQIKIFLPEKEIVANCRKIYSKQSLVGKDSVMFINGISLSNITDNDVKFILKNCMKLSLQSQRME